MLLRYIGFPVLCACIWFAQACVKPAVHRAMPMDDLPPSVTSQSAERRVLVGAWEYIVEGAAIRLAVDGQGNSRYDWKDGRLETRSLIGHTWRGIWFQKENDREGGFVVEFSSDFLEGEGRWWYSRIGTDHAPMQKGGTFHLRKTTNRMNHREIRPAP